MSTAPIYGGPPDQAGPAAPVPPAAPPPKGKKKVGLLILVVVLVAGCVPCTGVIAAIGIPAFINYVRRAKVVEAESNLRSLFIGAASYYDQERTGPDGTIQSGCTVGPAVTTNVPTDTAQVLRAFDPPFLDLGFAPSDPVFYQYEIVAGPASCDHGPNQSIYTFRAHGDLDGDGVTSLYELSVGTDAQGMLYRSPAFYTERELE